MVTPLLPCCFPIFWQILLLLAATEYSLGAVQNADRLCAKPVTAINASNCFVGSVMVLCYFCSLWMSFCNASLSCSILVSCDSLTQAGLEDEVFADLDVNVAGTILMGCMTSTIRWMVHKLYGNSSVT